MKKKVFFIFVFVLICLRSDAQVSLAAQSLYKKATNFKLLHQDAKAYICMERAIQASPHFEAAYSTLGAWYFQSHMYSRAAALYQKASYNLPNGHKTYARILAQSYMLSGQLDAAIFVVRAQNSESEFWNKLEQQIEFIREAKLNMLTDTVRNLGIRINTPNSEMYPCIAADGQSLFYTRRTKGFDEDFYRSDEDSCGGWFAGIQLKYPLNTYSQEAACMISADKHYLFFMRCENRSENGWTQGGCDLYMSYTGDTSWSIPGSFGATINTPGFEGMPCLSSDNRYLYFVSDRPGGYGKMDIWMSKFEHGLWQAPRNLGPSVNTAGNETSPFLYADNETLYFTSDGLPGMGGTDIYCSKKTGDSTWSSAKNIGYPVNSTFDENGFVLTSNGKRAYFSSNRDSVQANYDIYEIDLPISLQPKPMVFVKCRVYDSLTQNPLDYTGVFVNDARGKELYHYTSNRGDGSFMIPMPTGVKYSLEIDRIEFQPLEEGLEFDDSMAGKMVYHPIPLLPDGYEIEAPPSTDTTILQLFFRKNSVEMNDQLRKQITDVMSYWKTQKKITVLVNGYTDNTGTPMINESISAKRASLVTQELYMIGIEPSSIITEGRGEASPIVENDTEEHRDMNRRVEIVIRK